jgi:hypothetical protein
MKRIYTLLFSILIFSSAQAQNPVPNPSFQNWTGSVPTSWLDWAGNGTISQTTPGYDASPAVRGAVVVSGPNTYTPYLTTDTAGGGFSVNQNFAYLRFYYKTNLATGGGADDKIVINIAMKTSSGGSAGFANSAQNTITLDAATFTAKQVPIIYTGTAARAVITFTVQPTDGGPNPHLGTYFIIDSVSLTNSALIGIHEIEETSKLEVYPNPVQDFLNFKTEATKPMRLKLSDALGNVVLQRMSADPIGGYIDEAINVQNLSSGVYFLMLTSDKKTILRRILVD